MSTITVRYDGDDILFSGWSDEDLFVGKLESALGTKAKRRRFLIFVKRIEFVIDREVVPLFVDEDGSAHLEMRKNSSSVKEKVVRRIRSSNDFREA
jgi:hypothetical protein